MQIKTLPAEVKTITGSDPEGTFEALVSTYAVDSVGDQVQPGAFTKTLADWGSSGSPLPVIWSHQHDDPFAQGATVYRKGGVRVESTNSHDDDFTSNLVTVRAEERLALAVRYPAGFCQVTLL
jgi:hypothetical protein